MRSIRRVSFQNKTGDRYRLNGENGVYVSGLSGLGFSTSAVFADLGRGFFSPVSDESDPQNTLSFTLHFTRNGYAAYQNFVNWIAAAEMLTLVYQAPGLQEYYRQVTINFLQKGELNSVGWLEIPCSCYCATPWYRPEPTPLVIEAGGSVNVMRYDYTYDESLCYGFDSTDALAGTIAGGGHVPGALTFRYYGGVTNPRIRLIGDVSGKTYGVCSVTAVLKPSDTLIYSSQYNNSFVAKVAADGSQTDLLDVLDLSVEPFFHIPVDESCTITMEADSVINGKAELLSYYYFRSV